MVKIKGDKFKAVVIDDSDITVTVDKKAHLYGGGKFDGGDLFATYGLVEDITASPDGNTYKINGHVRGLLGGVTTFGDDTTIKLGKTADVSATIGVGLGSLDLSDPSVLESISLGSVSASGDDSKIIIAKGATVGGLIGTSILGGDSSITNNGDLSGSLVGMIAGDLGALVSGVIVKQAAKSSADTLLTNNGHIDAAVGMISIGLGGETEINIGKKGQLIAGFLGVGALDITGTGHTEFNNAGTIRVTMSIPELVLPIPGLSSAAYFSIGGEDDVKNSGKIFGNIFLGDGDDVITNTGKITGKVYGSTGDDTFIVGSAKDKLVELDGEGNKDTIKSSFTYTLSDFVEKLVLTGKGDIDGTGNAGDNILIGNKGGDNKLTGDLGLDTFVFATKGAHDTITDFTVADDTLDLSGWKGMVDNTFLDAHAQEKDGDVVITLGKDVLVIENHTLVDLDTANIIYAAV